MIGVLRLVVIVALLSTLLLTVEPTHGQSSSGLVVAEVYPAPIGYAFVFSPPYPKSIYGYRNFAGNYYSYRAYLESGIYIVRISDPLHIETIVHPEGSSMLRIINPDNMLKVYGLDIEGYNDIILFGQGRVYLSSYDIVYGVPRYLDNPMAVVVGDHAVNLNLTTIKVLSISTDGYVTVYPPTGGMSLSLRLSDLIDAPEACVAWFKYPPQNFPWVGGIVLSPACTKNIDVLKTAEYAGRLFAVVFRIPSVPKYGGKIDYVVMGRPTARVLMEAGLVAPARMYHQDVHIITGHDLSRMKVYVAYNENSMLYRGETYQVRNVTQVVKTGKTTRYVCSLPAKANVIYALMWGKRNLTGTLDLLPGEVILYEYDNAHYYCAGDLTWIDKGDPPLLRGPVYREFIHPIIIYTTTGNPVIVVASNGTVLYGASVELPFEVYASNMVFWYSGKYTGIVEISLTSIFTSTFFVIFILIIMVIVGMVVFGRGKEAPEKIAIIWDVKPPPPLSMADSETVSQTAKKHVEAFGVCPDLIDLAMYHEIIPPIPENGGSADEIIVCPFKTNERTESVLRYIVRVLQTLFWGIRRLWKSRGYIYTVFGDEMLYMYFYKQEDEDRPELIVANALESVVRSSSFESTYFRRPLGLVIIVDEDMLPLVKREISFLEELSLTPSHDEAEQKPRSYNVRGYLSSRNVSTSISVERIQEIIDKEVPKILVISRGNINELLEYLSEKSSMKGNEYMKRGFAEE